MFFSLEAQEGVGFDLALRGATLVVLYVEVGAQLVLCFESDVALGFAGLVGADHVRAREMDFQVFVRVIVNVFVVVSAKMACQVISRQVIEELQVIKEKLFTKVAIGMGKYLSMPLIADVSELYMLS